MPTTDTPVATSWDAELATRQHRLAETLRALVASVPGDDEISGLNEIADRWDATAAAPGTQPADLRGLLEEIETARAEVARRLPSRPMLAARRIGAALERVGAGRTLADVLRLAPAEVCWAGDFDRVLLSRVEGSSWRPESWHAAADPSAPATESFGAFLREARIPLGSGMIEAEVVRRRRTVLVGDAAAEPRTHPALVDIADCRSYVVAPVVAAEQVVGLLHADTRASGRVLDESDRVSLRAFADGLGLILERLALLDQLASQRRQISAALAAAEHAVEALSDAPVTLDVEAAPAAEPALANPETAPLDRLLTTREREVFAVLVSGATNAEIADRLTVSETTVKSHVKHILRKLRAANRAEAIARYLTMTGNQTRHGA